MRHLAPFIPSPGDPWDAAHAAHLLRRAGFGGPPAEVERLAARSPAEAVESLLDFETGAAAFEESVEEHRPEFDAAHGVGARMDGLRREWIYRMVHTPHPLREKLTLFWHDHFALQESVVVREPLVRLHVDTLRAHGAGPFRGLLRAVAADPGMLVQLDNRLNEAGAPNENYARELMELHALGVDNYSQRDVVALARVFTGWSTPQPHVPEFVFNAERHDARDKLFLGRTIEGRGGQRGLAEGEEALDLIVAQDACASFLASKLLRWFASHAPPLEVVSELAAALRENGLDVSGALRTLFSSTWFHAREQRFALYKNPLEMAVCAARGLGLQNAHLAGLEQLARRMGMHLFEPPSVAGWEHGAAWVNSGAIVQRFNSALAISELPHTSRAIVGHPALDFDALCEVAGDTGRLADALAARLLQRALAPAQRAALVAFLDEAAAAGEPGRSAQKRWRDVTRAAVHLVLCVPEYALS
jgi:uncharacterized protein (DUF1800 family)